MGALAGAVESIWAILRALLAGRKAPRNCKVALVRVFNPAKSSFMFPTKALAAPLETAELKWEPFLCPKTPFSPFPQMIKTHTYIWQLSLTIWVRKMSNDHYQKPASDILKITKKLYTKKVPFQDFISAGDNDDGGGILRAD